MMKKPSHLGRLGSLGAPCVLGLLVVLATASRVSAESTIISGTSNLPLSSHPVLGSEGVDFSGVGLSDDGGLGLGNVEMLVDLTGYASLIDPVTIEDVTISFGGGDVMFSFGPATNTPGVPPPGIIGTGSILAEITSASTTIAGEDFSNFIGGSVVITYNGAAITPGTSGGGANGSVLFGSVSSASFTFAVVPEPSSIAMMCLGGFGALLMVMRLRKKALR